MSKFLYLYRGPATPMEDFTPEQGAEQARAWGEWMAKVGPSLADGGAPFGARAAVSDGPTRPIHSPQARICSADCSGVISSIAAAGPR